MPAYNNIAKTPTGHTNFAKTDKARRNSVSVPEASGAGIGEMTEVSGIIRETSGNAVSLREVSVSPDDTRAGSESETEFGERI